MKDKREYGWIDLAVGAILCVTWVIFVPSVEERLEDLESRPPCPCSLEQEPEEEAVLDLPRFPKGRVR